MEKKSSKVCVTGGSCYIGSSLVKNLLHKGYTVHATVRNLGDESKVGLLKVLPGAESRLVLFEADIYDAETFESAIRGCEYVFLVATPYQPHHAPKTSKYKDNIEAAVDAVRIIMRLCEELGSVRRVVYTGSITAMSPLKDDGTGYKHSLNECCWTPIHLSFAHCDELRNAYTISKTLAEKEFLSYNDKVEKETMEAVSLVVALVGGDAILPYVPETVQIIVSPLNDDPDRQRLLKFLQTLFGSVSLVHVDDVCEAHVFCIEQPSMAGRYLCAAAYPSLAELLEYCKHKYPNQMTMIDESEGADAKMTCSSAKLVELGFKYKYGMEQIIDDSVECMKRLSAAETS